METLIMIERGRTQLVLQPENDHDKEVIKLLEKLPGTHRDNFYRCQGGWTRHVSSMDPDSDKDLVIVFDEVEELPEKTIQPGIVHVSKIKTNVTPDKG